METQNLEVNKYVFVMEIYRVSQFLFWKRKVFRTTDIRIIEADSDELAKAIARQTVDLMNKASDSTSLYRESTLNRTSKVHREFEDYQTKNYIH